MSLAKQAINHLTQLKEDKFKSCLPDTIEIYEGKMKEIEIAVTLVESKDTDTAIRAIRSENKKWSVFKLSESKLGIVTNGYTSGFAVSDEDNVEHILINSNVGRFTFR